MEDFSAASVNTLSSFESEGILADFFVDSSSIESEQNTEDRDNGEESFPMHRKLLRRRHVRKLQKTKERERQRKEEEEKQKELTRERDRKRRAEKSRSLRQQEHVSKTKSSAKRIREAEVHTVSPVPSQGGYLIKGTYNNIIVNNNSVPYYMTSPTCVADVHQMMVSTSTKSSSPVVDLTSTRSSCRYGVNMTHACSARSMEGNFGHRVSFSLPEFSPVRPSKFRKLQL